MSESPAPPEPVPLPAPHVRPRGRPGEPERLPLRAFPASLVITAAVLVGFLLEHLVSSQGDVLLRLGAVRGDLVLDDGEWFRLFCAAFLHNGLLHLVLNGLALIQLAPLVELLWGSSRLTVVYLLSALGGTLASALSQPVPSVGASGAILGLAGLLLGATWFAREPLRSRLREVLGRRLLTAVLLTFGLGIALQVGGNGFIDNMGHLGGIVAGFACSLLYRDPAARPGKVTHGVAAVLSLACAGSFLWMAVTPGRDPLEDQLRWHASVQARSPEHPVAEELTLRLAEALAETGEPARAREVLLRRLEAAPDSPAALDRLARGVSLEDDVPASLRPQLAALAARALAGLGPDPAPGPEALGRAERLDALAKLLAAGGDVATATAVEDRAIALLDACVRATPEDPRALNALAWTLVTRADPARSDPERARPLAWEAVRLLEGAPLGFTRDAQVSLAGALDTLGEVLLQLGRLDDAAGFQRRAIDVARGLAEARHLLPELTRRLDQIEAARLARRRI